MNNAVPANPVDRARNPGIEHITKELYRTKSVGVDDSIRFISGRIKNMVHEPQIQESRNTTLYLHLVPPAGVQASQALTTADNPIAHTDE